MRAVIQRVTQGSVSVDGEVVGSIKQGIVALIAVEPEDSEKSAEKLIDRLINYRIFNDEEGKMNRSLLEIEGELLLISQFTLAADTKRGRRPSFTTAASPALGEQLFNHALTYAKESPLKVESGIFGADMKVSLTNDGPVTFILEA